jgi:hypothetical protein
MRDQRKGNNGTQVFSSASGDLFNGFFALAKKWQFDQSDLVDNRGRPVYDLANRAWAHAHHRPRRVLYGR